MGTRLYYNAKVFTGSGEDDFADAFRVRDGRFVWAGHLVSAPDADAVDLGGKTVIPGLLETHTHPTYVAQTLSAVACTISNVTSIADMIEALKTHPNFGKGENDWIQGWGYDESKLAEHRTPTREDLDKVSTTQPVYVLRSDVHSAVVNTRALEIAGITRDTPDPKGGAFGRDADGEPNGVLIELAANAAVRAVMEKADFESAVKSLAAVGPYLTERGYCAASEMLTFLKPLNQIDVFRAAARVPNGLRQQACLYVVWTGGKDPFGMPDMAESVRSGRIKVAGIKLFVDGSISGKTAWVSEPYRESRSNGMCVLDDETLSAAYEYAKRNQLQISCHVMGDLAIQKILDFFNDKAPWLPAPTPSVRLEHATLLNASQLESMRASPMRYGAATQMIFGFAESDGYVEALTGRVMKTIYPLKLFYGSLPDLSLSSDAPATTWNDPEDAFVSIQAAVTRKAYDGTDLNTQEALTVPQALLLYTGRAANLCPYDVPVGRIAEGYEADFNILTDDIFSAAPEDIAKVRIEKTFFEGECVYDRSNR